MNGIIKVGAAGSTYDIEGAGMATLVSDSLVFGIVHRKLRLIVLLTFESHILAFI
jgi:hypothetical protein